MTSQDDPNQIGDLVMWMHKRSVWHGRAQVCTVNLFMLLAELKVGSNLSKKFSSAVYKAWLDKMWEGSSKNDKSSSRT